MAASIDMFGPGGEGLGGLFVGNQMAMQRDAAELERQKAMIDMANTQAITRQRELGNEYEGAILGDKVAAFKDEALRKKQSADTERFNKQGEQFGRLGQMLAGVPAAARPAMLKQMASQAGIADDNPMLAHLMGQDPETLPQMMGEFSDKFYKQGDAARAETLRRDAMFKQAEMQAAAKAAEGEANREMRRDIAAQASADRRAMAAMAAGSRERVAATKAAGKGGGPVDVMSMVASGKLDPKKAITYYEMKEAAEGITEEEARAKENLQRFVLSQPVVGKPDTGPMIGLPSQQQRITAAIKGEQPQGKPAGQAAASVPETDLAAAVKRAGQTYEPDKFEYQVRDGKVYKRAKQRGGAALPPK